MSPDSERPRPSNAGRAPSQPPSAWPGALIGAALGGVVGALSLLIPVDPAPFPGTSGTGSASVTATAGVTATASATATASGSVTAAADETEAEYLARATAQIGGAPADALAMAEAHAARFPEGKLGQEREMIAISALAALGKKPEARARAKLFLTLFPDSVHRPRLEELVPELKADKPATAP